MKKIITTLIISITTSVYSEVININTGQVLSDYPTQISDESGIIDFPNSNTLYSAGWRVAEPVTTTNIIVTDIPDTIQLAASRYTNILNSIFGDGSHTNKEITEEYVTVTLALDESSDPNLAIRLKALYDIINSYWGRGEVWSFPYGQTSYTTTSVNTTWKAPLN